MKGPLRERFGIWLGRCRFLHPVLGKFTHEFDGKRFYVNRISGTLLYTRPVSSGRSRTSSGSES